jgi:DNA-binding response OmpR family regulator
MMGAATEPPSTILVVEDERAIRELLRLTLQRHRYEVIPAAGGREALKLAAAHPEPIDLLVTDVVLPDLDGYELAAELQGANPGLKVLYISGFPSRESGKPGKAGHDYLAKPFEMAALVAKIQAILDQGARQSATV